MQFQFLRRYRFDRPSHFFAICKKQKQGKQPEKFFKNIIVVHTANIYIYIPTNKQLVFSIVSEIYIDYK